MTTDTLKSSWASFSSRLRKDAAKLKDVDRRVLAGVAVFLVMLLVYAASRLGESQVRVIETKEGVSFEGGRVLDSRRTLYERKEKLLSRRIQEMELGQKALLDNLELLEKKLGEIESNKVPSNEAATVPQGENAPTQPGAEQNATTPEGQGADSGIRVSDPNRHYETSKVSGRAPGLEEGSYRPSIRVGSIARPARAKRAGPELISFPVKEKTREAENAVHVPAGSYVKAKLLTGVEAPEGKTLPVLLQADYAFIGPNKTRVDLSGCFLIAKSTGNLSIERVEMQATKISCVSGKGKMFEKEIAGFVADNKDNSFAVIGSVNSKQDRVAAMAFLSSVVEGVGKAIQQAQTSTQTNALGGTSPSITGDQAKYMAAGGASNAASMVTQWYLKQAQNLLPTINIGSGQDVWIVLQDSVSLPNWYFKKTDNQRRTGNEMSFITRLLD